MIRSGQVSISIIGQLGEFVHHHLVQINLDLNLTLSSDLEWYDPSAITTADGKLVITITQEPIHNLNFKSGMLQSWNKFCFNKNAYIEFSASLPGTSGIGGFWPGVWTMGNLGRPGYGASTEGMWP